MHLYNKSKITKGDYREKISIVSLDDTLPLPHQPSPLPAAKSNRVPILQNFDNHPSHMKITILSVLTKENIHILYSR